VSAPLFSRAAQAYGRTFRLAVFPLQVKGKKPLPYTTGLLAAATDPQLAADRWAALVDLPLRPPKYDGERIPKRVRANPNCNVACATGEISGCWVLDLDGQEAEEDLAQLVAVNGELPATPEQRTGGGRQLFFAWDPAFEIRNSASKIGRGIDVRGNGGYVVLPPSIHPGNPAKGVPPGRVYTWADGKSPRELPFAVAPTWLLQLACPPAPAAPSTPVTPRKIDRQGGTTKFGQATLATACRLVMQAGQGQRQSTLWGYSAFIGGYVAGGEIDAAQAREELIQAGLNMQGGLCDTPQMIVRHVERGLAAGERHPKTAAEQRPFQPMTRREAVRPDRTAAQDAGEILGARGLWDSARPADCRAVRSWFAAYGLDPAGLPGGLGQLRAHQRAPIGEGQTGPALLVPLVDQLVGEDWGEEIEALAVLPLMGRGGISNCVGPFRGRVAALTPLPADGSVLVGMTFLDAWTLGQNAYANGHELGVILAPSLRTFAGGPLGDRWSRLDPRTPFADPENPPWTLEGPRAVFLAVRGDLRSPEFKVRKTFGGTDRVTLQGDAAARFYAGLAEQAWRRAGANPVRILKPSAGAGFSEGRPA